MNKINHNGSKWAGESSDSIEALLQRLASTPLDPSFEDLGNFVMPARCCKVSYDDAGQKIYTDAGPIYPEAPNAVRFFGNFMEISAVFSIDTDEPELIERLTLAIRANQASTAYQAFKVQADLDRQMQRGIDHIARRDRQWTDVMDGFANTVYRSAP